MDLYLSALVYSKDSVQMLSGECPSSWRSVFKGGLLCTSTGDVPLSGWGQRSGILHKNINEVPKIQEIKFLCIF